MYKYNVYVSTFTPPAEADMSILNHCTVEMGVSAFLYRGVYLLFLFFLNMTYHATGVKTIFRNVVPETGVMCQNIEGD